MKKILVVIMAMLFCFTPFVGCATMDKEKNKDSIGSISLSPDGRKILFHRSQGGNPYYMIQVYDLQTGELSAYRSPDGEEWNDARYSFDGKSIVFRITPHKENQRDIANSQIAIMTPDGRKVREITSSTGFKGYPSFSHAGKKVIYIKSGIIRKEGKTPAADYDIYEVDLETGKETRLTWFKFFMMSPPYYLPDDKTFMFSAESPFAYPGSPSNDYKSMEKIRAEIKAKYKDNNIFLMHGNEKVLKPYVEYYKESDHPLLSADGSILIFRGLAYKPDGRGDWEQFFQHATDGKHRRITNLHATSIWSGAISNDGALLAVVYDAAPEREIRRIVIYQVKDGTSREITLPDQPSRIINR